MLPPPHVLSAPSKLCLKAEKLGALHGSEELRQLLLLILNAVISTLLSVLFIGALIGDETTRTVIQQVVNLVANVAWAPVQWGTFTVLYYDLRVRREAFDLQLAAEALPR